VEVLNGKSLLLCILKTGAVAAKRVQADAEIAGKRALITGRR
jgi:hypothetical protein